jgi:hypothetical protein
MMKFPGNLGGENLLTYEYPMSSFHRPEREVRKMPLLFYSPFIIWTGLFEVAQEEPDPCQGQALRETRR